MSEPVVTYSVKEVLDRIERKLDGFANRLSERVDGHEIRIKALEDAKLAGETKAKVRGEWRRWVIPVVLSVLTIVVLALQVWVP